MSTETLTGKDRRASERVTDDSTLLVSGYTDQGDPFAVLTCIHDISLTGISFTLDFPISQNATVQLAICSKRIEGLIFGIRAMTVRILQSGPQSGRHLVAARFVGEFVQMGNNPATEDMAHKLEEAVKYDERTRFAEDGNVGRCCEICGKAFVAPPEVLRVSTQVSCFPCHLRQQSEIRVIEQSSLRADASPQEPVKEKLS